MKETLLKDAKQNLILMLSAAFIGLYSTGQANAEPSVKFNTVDNPNALHYAISEMLMHNMATDAMTTLRFICPKGATKATIWARALFTRHIKKSDIQGTENYTILASPLEERKSTGWNFYKGLEGNGVSSDFALSIKALEYTAIFPIVQCYDKNNRRLISYKSGFRPVLKKPDLESLKDLEIRILYNLSIFGYMNQKQIFKRYPDKSQMYGRTYIYINKLDSGYPVSELAITFGDINNTLLSKISSFNTKNNKLKAGDLLGRVWYYRAENASMNPDGLERLSRFHTSQSLFDITIIPSMISGKFDPKRKPYYPAILPDRFVNMFNKFKPRKKEKIPTPKPRPKNLKRSSLESQKTEKEIVSVEPVSAGAQGKSD